MNSSVKCLDNADSDELLPPSAFLPSAKLLSNLQVPLQLSATDGSAHSPTIADIHNRGATHFQLTRSDNPEVLASAISKLAAPETRVQELAQELHAVKRENLLLQHSRDAARAELRHLRAYISSAKWMSPDLQQSEEINLKAVSLGETKHSVALEKQIAELNEQNENLKRELDLSAVRVRSIEAVLQLQEKSLCASNPHDDGKVLVDSHSLVKSERLLTGWRSQVLRLLIQAEQYKADLAHAIGETRRKAADLEQCRQAVTVEQETSQLKTKAWEAAITSERQKYEMLSKQFDKEAIRFQDVHNKFADLQKTASLSLTSVHALTTQLALCVQGFLHSDAVSPLSTNNGPSFVHVFQRLRQLERRLAFAIDRLPVLRTQLSSRRGIPVERMDQAVQTQSVVRHCVGGPLSPSELEELLSHANMESRRLREERDSALNKLERSSKTFQQRVEAAREEVKQEIVSLRDLVGTLEERLKSKDQEVIECHAQIDRLKADQLAQQQQQQQTDEEHTRLQAQYAQAQERLAQAQAELRDTERRITRVLGERRAQLAELEGSCDPMLKRLEYANPIEKPITRTNPSIGPRILHCAQSSDAMNASLITPNSEHLDGLAKSLQQLTMLAARLNSDGSSGSGDEHDGS